METLVYLNSNDSKNLLGLGERARLTLNSGDDFAQLQQFVSDHKGAYIFAGLSYDLKSTTIGLNSSRESELEIPDAFLWVPEVVVEMKEETISKVLQGTLNEDTETRIHDFFNARNRSIQWSPQLRARTPKTDYLKTVSSLLHEIQMGTIYEINYCQEFFDDGADLNDLEAAYFKLNGITEAPFSAYVAFDDFRILCGSPERYLQKKDNRLISQPIKGTSRRGASEAEDLALKEALVQDPKERSENVMIVDLVRNDLSKIAQKGSVNVDELFGVYSFKTVHQLISTISCEVKPECSFETILRATFPMGSMTGAPKKSAVSLIESHENFRRGLYSGSIGYIEPNGDFDFNVVIRTLQYNIKNRYLSCAVGGAITAQSTAEAEYEECKVKVKTILDQMHA